MCCSVEWDQAFINPSYWLGCCSMYSALQTLHVSIVLSKPKSSHRLPLGYTVLTEAEEELAVFEV